MNLSGKFIKNICLKNKFNISSENTFIICDHLEKPIGKW